MSQYKRAYQQGGCYFFTVVTYERKCLLTEPQGIQRLKEAFRRVRTQRPFVVDAIVVLPDHLHCIWQLPDQDADFSSRWRLIKRYFSVGVDAGVSRRREKQIWQRRFWEHVVRDEEDWRCHMDYIHYNPVKHGYVERPYDWSHSSFRRAMKHGLYPPDWGASQPTVIAGMDFE